MSMATLIDGGYYVNMGKLMTNYLLKVYCTMNICAAISDLLHPSTESLLNHEHGINLFFYVIFKLGTQSKWQLQFIKTSNKQLVFLIPEFLFNALTFLFAQ